MRHDLDTQGSANNAPEVVAFVDLEIVAMRFHSRIERPYLPTMPAGLSISPSTHCNHA